jgi:hypothetical protein
VDSPPNPTLDPQTAPLSTAFVVHVPRVAARDHFEFTILTADSDNQRAGKQFRRIQSEIKSILVSFGQRLAATAPDDARRWQLEKVLAAYTKRSSFFLPAKVSYAGGRESVSFLTEDELVAEAVNQDLYPRYKARFIDIYQGRPEFLAPVVRIMTKDGVSTYAVYPPYVRTYVDMYLSVDELKEKGSVVLHPPVPKEY